jgi:hypothetical protein
MISKIGIVGAVLALMLVTGFILRRVGKPYSTLVFVALPASGGVISAADKVPGGMALIHKVFPYLAVVSSVGMLYFLV